MATFNDLPMELVRHIWSFLRYDPAGKRHLCTALVPLVRRHNFKDTSITSRERLHSFEGLVVPPDTFSRRSGGVTTVAQNVHRLELYPIGVRQPPVGTGGLNEALGPLKSILRRCREMKQLICYGQGAMSVLFSPPALPRLERHKLEELFFYEVEAELGMPLSQGHLRRLHRFPALRALALDLAWDGDEAEPFGPVVTTRLRAVGPSRITLLCLAAGESLATPGAALFIADFAQLTQLELTLRSDADIGPFLQACPITIASLTIRIADELEDEEIEPLQVEADLARFVNLKDLTLGADIYSPTCELFPILSAHLPCLRTLVLESDTSLVADKLLDYVIARGGPSRRLKKVVLESVLVSWNPLPSQNPDRPDVVNGTFSFNREWYPPRWTASFGLADAHALIAAAKRVGVKLKGNTVRAVEYDEVRAREEAYLQTRRDDILYSLRDLFGEGDGDV